MQEKESERHTPQKQFIPYFSATRKQVEIKKRKQNERERESAKREVCFLFLVVDLCQKQTNRTSAIVFRFVTCVCARERARNWRERESKQALSVRE